MENGNGFFSFDTSKLNESKSSYVYEFITRILDILFFIITSLIAIPILIISGIAIKLDSRGPVFYSQSRLGKNGSEFIIYKLRTMHCNAEENGAQWAIVNDTRITDVGKFLRRTRIDELPQLWNIFKGEMTLVGPRPERCIFTDEFDEIIPGFRNRLIVKPGLTGWAQVNGGYDISPKEKLELDMYFIKNRNLSLYIKICMRTLGVVITGEGSR